MDPGLESIDELLGLSARSYLLVYLVVVTYRMEIRTTVSTCLRITSSRLASLDISSSVSLFARDK
jgi:hypothetical protein